MRTNHTNHVYRWTIFVITYTLLGFSVFMPVFNGGADNGTIPPLPTRVTALECVEDGEIVACEVTGEVQ